MGNQRRNTYLLRTISVFWTNKRCFKFPNTARLLKCTVTLLSVMAVMWVINFGTLSIFYNSNKSLPWNKSNRPSKLSNINGMVSYQHKLCLSFLGRLGNQMFQYASAFGISKVKNMQVRVRWNDKVAQIFNISAQKVMNSAHCSHAFQKYERFSCAYDPQLLNFSTTHDVLLLYYLQSWKYFINVTSALRREFTFKPRIKNLADEIFYNTTKHMKYFNKNATYVGLHIRRGDMVPQNKTKSYLVATRAYILRAMSFYLHRYPKTIFVICSDDMRWVKKQFERYVQLLRLTFVAREPPEIELAVLSLCDHIIMTTGTYSWWAAWLANGTAIYYKHYIHEDSDLRKQFSHDFSDFFYPGWIAME